MNKQWFGISAVLTSVVLLTTACDPLISQDPKDFFKDGKFPKQLEWIRSQMRELSQKNKDQIVARTEADAKRTDLLKVAVIDSGVDIAHPDLINQISYRVENSRIVGAGHDIMGDGKFGAHVLVDSTLFAFGAKDIQQGKIVSPVNSPLALLKDMNDRFRSLVIQGIQNDPDLKSSLFSNLKAETFTIFGLDDYRTEYGEDEIKEYKEAKENGRLFGTNIKPKEDSRDIEQDLKFGWATMEERRQKPDALSYASIIEHSDKFAQVVINAYKQLDQEKEYSKKLDMFIRFNFALSEPGKEISSKELKEIPDKLKEAMTYIVYGLDLYDPIASLERIFRSSRTYQGLEFSEAFLLFYKKQVSDIDELLKTDSVSDKNKKSLMKAKSELKVLYSAIQTLIELKNDPVAYQKMRSQLRRNIVRTMHPYISSQSAENKHGTHVSGIIAAQNPNIRIVPIRVTTQTVALNPARQKVINAELVAQFQEFMKSPYYAPLREMIGTEYGNPKIADSTIVKEVTNYLKENSINSVFIKDVLNAVEAAGKEQAKLANVSLGTTFKKNPSLDKKAASMAEDLFSEFARFKIGQTIQEKAPGTLFMIATGNDGGWIDGVSKTAFPVGITSLRLMKLAEAQKTPVSPNNAARNVLAVASINPNGTLTPFTNILIDPNIPQIYSTGEEIMSSVPNKSQEAANKAVTERLRKLMALTKQADALQEEIAETKPVEQRLEHLRSSTQELLTAMQLTKSLATLVHLDAPVGRESMSGTSMATPTVTGLLANYIIEKMKANGISSDQVYTHPDLSPEKIVSDVMKMSRTNKLTPMMTVQMLVDGIKQWKKDPRAQQQIRKAGTMTRPRCEAVYHF